MIDPYEALSDHLVIALALYCEHGCERAEASGYSKPDKAAKDLAKRGWVVREYGGDEIVLCRDCAAVYDKTNEERTK